MSQLFFSIILAMIIFKSTPKEMVQESNRMIQAMGTSGILPQLLGALGAIFALAVSVTSLRKLSVDLFRKAIDYLVLLPMFSVWLFSRLLWEMVLLLLLLSRRYWRAVRYYARSEIRR